MEQQRLTYPLTPNSLVLDVGAYQGKFTREIHQRYGCKVIAFEPVHRFYANVAAEFSGNPKIQVMNYGLGDRTSRFQMAVRNDSSSLYLDAEEYEQVEIVAIGDFFRSLVGEVDLLKINIEGSEYGLLDSMLELDLVRRVKYLQIQFHHYGPNEKGAPSVGGTPSPTTAARRDRIREGLKKTHDEMWCYLMIWESWARR